MRISGVAQKRADDADRDANRGERRALAQHEAQHVALPGAERDANADLLRALGDGVRDHAVDADHREHERDGGEHRQQRRVQSRLPDGLIDQFAHARAL